jgi:hypothetical protein
MYAAFGGGGAKRAAPSAEQPSQPAVVGTVENEGVIFIYQVPTNPLILLQ